MTHMYFSARTEGRISYGHLGRTNSCFYCELLLYIGCKENHQKRQPRLPLANVLKTRGQLRRLSGISHCNCICIMPVSHWRELFARTISANVRVRVSVNVQAKTTPRTFTIRANYSRQCETGIRNQTLTLMYHMQSLISQKNYGRKSLHKLSWCWQTRATRLEVSQGHQTW